MTQGSIDRIQRKAMYYDTVLGLSAAGVTIYEIEKRMGIPRSTVRRWVGKPYVPLPPPERLCDCGQLAIRLDVPLTIGTSDGYISTAAYDLCEDCYSLEHEPVQTRWENVHNR
jgi:hypothetical protein